MKKKSTNDVHKRTFKSQLDPAFQSIGKADYANQIGRKRRKTGGIGGKRIISKAIKGHQRVESDAILGL
jgi:hypothetical protein